MQATRSSRSRLLAPLPAVLLVVAFWAVAASTSPAVAGGTEPGLDVFLAQKCNFCHAIESRGVEAKNPEAEGGDLSAVGTEHDAEWIQQLLKKEVDTDAGEPHKKGFKGEPADLETLATFLAGLKGEEG